VAQRLYGAEASLLGGGLRFGKKLGGFLRVGTTIGIRGEEVGGLHHGHERNHESRRCTVNRY